MPEHNTPDIQMIYFELANWNIERIDGYLKRNNLIAIRIKRNGCNYSVKLKKRDFFRDHRYIQKNDIKICLEFDF